MLVPESTLPNRARYSAPARPARPPQTTYAVRMRLRTDAGQPRGLGVGAERVQLPSAAEVLEVVGGDQQHGQGDQGEVRHRRDAAGAEVDEAAREVGRGDLPGADPDGVDAADDVERAEGDDERGYLAEADQQAVDESPADAEQHREEHRDDGVSAALQIGAYREGADAERGADRQVDVPGDHHQRLAGGDQHQDGRVQQQVLDALFGQELAVAHLGDDDHHQEDGQDGEFTHLEDAVHQPGPARPGNLGGGGGVGCGHRHAAALSVSVVVMRRPSRSLRPSRIPRWLRSAGSRRW